LARAYIVFKQQIASKQQATIKKKFDLQKETRNQTANKLMNFYPSTLKKSVFFVAASF
jgi:hypothetical protein